MASTEEKSTEEKRSTSLKLWPISSSLIAAFGLALFTALLVGGILWLVAGRPLFLINSSLEDNNSNPLTLQEQLDLTKVALSVVAGLGGLVALVVAYRRQRIAEDAHRHIQEVEKEKAFDAEERRVTELYSKSVEQLGHEKAPVRLGAMYALERLGEGNPRHRQSIVSILCAYLRMPYEEIDEDIRLNPLATEEQRNRYQLLLEEKEVRLTAERLLASHLQPNHQGSYWAEMSLDLRGVVLNDFVLSNCRVKDGVFTGATFNKGSFEGAEFIGSVDFARVSFKQSVSFDRAKFGDSVDFSYSRFNAQASFKNSYFSSSVRFVSTLFGQQVTFENSLFKNGLFVRNAHFQNKVTFKSGIFNQLAHFDTIKFEDRVDFDQAIFEVPPYFVGCTVSRRDGDGFFHSLPVGWRVIFDEVSARYLIIWHKEVKEEIDGVTWDPVFQRPY